MKRKEHEKRLNAFFDVLQGELNDLRPRSPEVAAAVERQRTRARKRARYHKRGLREAAFESFLSDDAAVACHEIRLCPDVVSNAQHFLTVVLERYATRHDPSCIQDTLSIPVLVDKWRFGPGSSHEDLDFLENEFLAKGTHAAVKLLRHWSCTPLCEPLVQRLRQSNPYLCRWDAARKDSGTYVVRGSRLATVFKNEETYRTICMEPTGNMVLQLAGGYYLMDVLRMIGLDVSTQQELNKLLARLGSIGGHVATIDLKSASNMEACRLVQKLWPPIWYQFLMSVRSPEVLIPGTGWHKLHMISSMGNGFTFPLMTLTIVALLYGYRACKKGTPNLFIDWEYTAVFGDDIIIPVDEYDGFCDVLTGAGFVINHDKSYRSGPFRESCGGDYWNGYDITPFYVKSLATASDVYVVLNQVSEWCGKHGVLLHRTLLLLKGYVDGKVLFVPEWRGPDEGFRCRVCPRRYKYLKTVLTRLPLRDLHFSMMLAVGGYISEGHRGGLQYLPRPDKVRKKVRTCRLPKGYLHGADPLTRSAQVTEFVATYVADVLAS